MSNKEAFLEDEIEVENFIYESKSNFDFTNNKKNNIKNWNFKNKNSIETEKLKTSDSIRNVYNYSVNFTDSTGKFNKTKIFSF